MNDLKKGIINVFTANVLNLLLGLFTGFIMPKYLSIDTYANIKNYQLYISYIGFMHLGFVDGVYLKFGGYKLDQIQSQYLRKSHSTLAVFQSVVMMFFLGVGIAFNDLALTFFAISILPLNIVNFYKNLYQATGEFVKYRDVLNINTILTFVFIVLLVGVLRVDNYVWYLGAYTLISIFIWLRIEIKNHQKLIEIKLFNFKELVSEIKAGIFLMLGNFSSLLLTSMDRWFIKALMDYIAFAEYSFAVSMENFLNIAITPVTTTLYNYLYTKNNEEHVKKIRRCLIIFASLLLSATFVIKFIIVHYLTKYQGAIEILFILFSTHLVYIPLKGIYVNLYKVEKKQKQYFRGIILIVILGAFLNGGLYLIMHKKEAFALGTLLTAIVWYLVCCIDFKKFALSFKELIFTIIEIILLILLGWKIEAVLGFFIYIIATIFLLIVLFRDEAILLTDIIKGKLKK